MAGPEPQLPAGGRTARRALRAAGVIVVGSVMFTFISYWRTAAIVLCDLASTTYYIGGIVEQAIGPAAPWFILAVMFFSYAVRSVYIESCSLFVRGGVYRVVKEAMGGFLAKVAVSALMFDYVLTGPISGVSAGQYLVGLVLELLGMIDPSLKIEDEASKTAIRHWGAVVIACAIILYFFRKNVIGIHESSDKALKIMVATTIMAVVMVVWCGATLATRGRSNSIPRAPDLGKKVEYASVETTDRVTGEKKELWARDPQSGRLVVKRDEAGQPVPRLNKVTHEPEDPLGFIGRFWPGLAAKLRQPGNWLSVVGVLGVLIAFGHSILAMSGEETLAQVYREVESPKLPNFKKAAFIVFMYSLVVTAGFSFLAVLIIPDEIRMKEYSENLLGGLAMYVIGPPAARLLLNGFVVLVGFLILAGAVNTALIGSNGVLNRVAEDGVLPVWLQRPHPKYGTTYRMLWLIVILQLFTTVASGGDTVLLGEAYAFGVVWSFVFQAGSMLRLRFRDPRPREFKVPFNIRIGGVEWPIGLSVIFLILVMTAVLNFLTKEVATVGGLVFTGVFLTLFKVSEHYHQRRGRGERLDQFTQQTEEDITPQNLGLENPYRKLVAIRSPHNLHMLEKALDETDPETTDVVVMTAKVAPVGSSPVGGVDLDSYDQELMTAVLKRAEKAGKHVVPLIVPTNNALFAVMRTAKQLQAQELIMGASNKYTAEEQLDQNAFYWINMHQGEPAPLTIRILGRNWDVHLDLAGGNRIPKISERKARSVAELRAAGVGVDRVLMVHDGTTESSDLFQGVLTMLDPQVGLTLAHVAPEEPAATNGNGVVAHDLEQAQRLEREVDVHEVKGDVGSEIVRLVRENKYDLVIVGVATARAAEPSQRLSDPIHFILSHAPCRVFLAAPVAISQEVEEEPKDGAAVSVEKAPP